jgi:hypothetical protein
MPQMEDLTGQRFGRLIAIKPIGKHKNRSIIWECKCDCGCITQALSARLKTGEKRSCGCLQKESEKMNLIKGQSKTIHGMRNTRIYVAWCDMKKRCNNPKDYNYKNYGGRGISVCVEWVNDFMSFFNWAMDNGYSKDLTIDRINNDGNYEPLNCRWVDNITQANNRRVTKKITIDGETNTLYYFSQKYGISREILYNRIFNLKLPKIKWLMPVKKYKKRPA